MRPGRAALCRNAHMLVWALTQTPRVSEALCLRMEEGIVGEGAVNQERDQSKHRTTEGDTPVQKHLDIKYRLGARCICDQDSKL